MVENVKESHLSNNPLVAIREFLEFIQNEIKRIDWKFIEDSG